jgi:hypothetical protein
MCEEKSVIQGETVQEKQLYQHLLFITFESSNPFERKKIYFDNFNTKRCSISRKSIHPYLSASFLISCHVSGFPVPNSAPDPKLYMSAVTRIRIQKDALINVVEPKPQPECIPNPVLDQIPVPDPT